jgi:hypothetical protein
MQKTKWICSWRKAAEAEYKEKALQSPYLKEAYEIIKADIMKI